METISKSRQAESLAQEHRAGNNSKRPILVVICLVVFAAGLVVLPNALQKVSAARKGSERHLAKGAKQRAVGKSILGAASLLAQDKGSTQAVSNQGEEDPDVPPFARGMIDKEEYLLRRNQHISLLRGLPYDTPYNPRIKAIQEMQHQRLQNAPDISNTMWEFVGPDPLPNGQTETTSTAVSGRVSAIAIHPTNSNIVYVGAAQGGVYRTTDGGTSWTPIFDSAQSLAIGSIAIAPSQPTTVYVGTGEPQGTCDSFFGIGIYRITNADTSPVLAGPFNSDGTNDVFTGRAVGRVVVHPTDPNTIFACTTSGIGGLGCEPFGGGTLPPLPARGLYRSTNALGGCTFTKMTTATATNVVAGNWPNVDIVMDPANPNRVAVSVNAPISPAGGGTGGGIYLSTDALAVTPTFTRTLSLESVRIELALHSAAGTVNVYAASGETSGRLRRSTDGGGTWSAVLAGASGFCGGQCFYNIAVAVDPTNPLLVMIGGNVTGASTKLIARSTNGGTNFTNVNSGVHADNHAVTFAPSNNQIAFMGTDGGIYKSTDNGQTWASRSIPGFSATQFQSIALHPSNFFFTIGGTQDNGTEFWEPSGMTAAWRRADFGDGGFALIDQNAPDTTNVTMYHTYFNQATAKGYARVLLTANATDNGWTFHGCGFGGSIPNGMTCGATETTLFYAPMASGPGIPNTLYFGADVLYRSADSGTNMAKVSQQPFVSGRPISAIGISPQNDNVRIVGMACNRATGECAGRVFRTVTGSNPLTDVSSASFPARFVGRTVIDPNNQNTAYVTFTGFAVPAGEHVWKTTNLNAVTPTWTASGTGIPDVPVNAFAVDPMNSMNLFAGTDIGVYRSTDGGTSWLPFGTGLPIVAVFDMAIQNANRFLRIATHGRGIWQISLQPTAVKLEGFVATGYDGGQFIDWKTGQEVDNLGFNVYRDEAGKRTRLNEQLVAGSALVAGEHNALTAGKSYAWWDGVTSGKRDFEYWLEEIDLNGESTWHGPAGSKAVGGAPPAESQAELLSRAGSSQALTGVTRLVGRNADPPGTSKGGGITPPNLSAATAIKVSVRTEGWYKISQPDLVAAGLDPNVNPRFLQLHVDGKQQPIKANGEQDGTFHPADSVEFYGVSVDAAWTDTRVYWLVAGSQPGQRIKQAPPRLGGRPSEASFAYTVERRDRTIYFSALRNGDRENFFGAVVASSPVDHTLNLQHLNLATSEQAVLEMAMQGVTRRQHRVLVQLNGIELEAIDFDGQARSVSRLLVNHSLLKEGTNQVRLTSAGGQSDVSVVDHIRLTYQHAYVAESNVLRFTAQGSQTVSVDGFSNGEIRVFDITDTAAVQEMAGAVKQKGETYGVTITAPGYGSRTLMAFTTDQARSAESVIANRPSNWRKASQGADLLIVTRDEFINGMDPLKKHRHGQGLSVAVIDIEDIYDEMNYGQKSPQAVKDFLSLAASSWKKPPRYVLFVGDSSFDPKNYLGLGEFDFVATKLLDTEHMETASDDWFADFNADGLAELAVGRLPVRTSQEAANVVAKIISYDRSSSSEAMLLVADSTDGYDFEAASSKLRALAPSNVQVEALNRGDLDPAAARATLFEAINRGQKIVNYAGHGATNLWRGNLLVSADAATLANRDRLSVFIMMTCLNGYFHDAGVESLAESLLKSGSGGAVAVWASAGMTDPGGQSFMNQEIYRQMFNTAGGRRLGDASLSAKAAVKNNDLRSTWILFGDPTTRLR